MRERGKGTSIKKESAQSKRKLPKPLKGSLSEVKKTISERKCQKKGFSKGEEETERLKRRLQTFKKGLEEREVELNRLREEVRYQNQQLASKDMEMESYKKITEERIFQLEAKVKELEAKIGSPSRPQSA